MQLIDLLLLYHHNKLLPDTWDQAYIRSNDLRLLTFIYIDTEVAYGVEHNWNKANEQYVYDFNNIEDNNIESISYAEFLKEL